MISERVGASSSQIDDMEWKWSWKIAFLSNNLIQMLFDILNLHPPKRHGHSKMKDNEILCWCLQSSREQTDDRLRKSDKPILRFSESRSSKLSISEYSKIVALPQ